MVHAHVVFHSICGKRTIRNLALLLIFWLNEPGQEHRKEWELQNKVEWVEDREERKQQSEEDRERGEANEGPLVEIYSVSDWPFWIANNFSCFDVIVVEVKESCGSPHLTDQFTDSTDGLLLEVFVVLVLTEEKLRSYRKHQAENGEDGESAHQIPDVAHDEVGGLSPKENEKPLYSDSWIEIFTI